jgi:hypothetical protein
VTVPSDIRHREAYNKTASSLDNNSYLDKATIEGAVEALVECALSLGVDPFALRAMCERQIRAKYER